MNLWDEPGGVFGCSRCGDDAFLHFCVDLWCLILLLKSSIVIELGWPVGGVLCTSIHHLNKASLICVKVFTKKAKWIDILNLTAGLFAVVEYNSTVRVNLLRTVLQNILEVHYFQYSFYIPNPISPVWVQVTQLYIFKLYTGLTGNIGAKQMRVGWGRETGLYLIFLKRSDIKIRYKHVIWFIFYYHMFMCSVCLHITFEKIMNHPPSIWC